MIVGVLMVRDELDIIGPILEHMLAEGLDRILIADHGSTDGTWEFLAGLADPRIQVESAAGVRGKAQEVVMNRLVEQAGQQGASWVVPFDADEVWYALSGATIAGELRALPEQTRVVVADVWEHLARPDDDPAVDPFRAMVHRRPGLWEWKKVVFRWQNGIFLWIGNHGVTPAGPAARGVLAVRHFPLRSEQQAVAKIRRRWELETWWNDERAAWWAPIAADAAGEWARFCADDQLVRDPAPVRS